MRAKIQITLKKAVLDPQGKAIEKTLKQLGFENIDDVRQGKIIEFNLTETDKNKAYQQIVNMCEKFLTKTIMEDYKIQLDSTESQ